MYTVTPLYFSNSALQYFAIERVKFFSIKLFATAPDSLPPCPGSNTTTKLPLLVKLLLVAIFPTILLVSAIVFSTFSSASSKLLLSIVTTEASTSFKETLPSPFSYPSYPS